MDNSISRRAAIDALGDEPEVWTSKDEYAHGLNKQWRYDRNAIKAVPSAQPERKSGKWTYIKNVWVNHSVKICRCSACNRPSYGAMNFCPNCGADMREEDGKNS